MQQSLAVQESVWGDERARVRAFFSLDLFVLKTLLFCLYLTPTLSAVPGFPSVRIDDGLALVWLFIFIFRKDTNFKAFPSRIFPLIGFVVLLPASILNGELGVYNVSVFDLNQYIRFAKYVAVYLLALGIVRNSSDDEKKRLFRLWMWLSFICFILAVVQYFDLGGFNGAYVQKVAPTQYLSLMGGHPNPRPVGMIGNPNELGYLFALSFLIVLYCKANWGGGWVVLMILSGLFFGVLMTLSRGALVSLLGGGVVYGFVLFTLSRKSRVSILLFSAGVVLLSGYFIISSEYVYERFLWRFESGVRLSEDASFGERVHNWSENIEYIKKNYLIGVGPLSRAGLQYAADNEWLLILRAYGVVGVLLIVSLFGVGVFRRARSDVKALHLGVTVSAFLFMIPASVFHSLELMSIVLVALAAIDAESSG